MVATSGNGSPDNGSSPSGAPPGANPSSSSSGGSNGGKDRANPDALYKAAQRYRNVADDLTNFSARNNHLATDAPLQHGQSDSSWQQFSVQYLPAASGFVEGLHVFAQSIHEVADRIDRMGKNHAAAEQHAIKFGEHLEGK